MERQTGRATQAILQNPTLNSLDGQTAQTGGLVTSNISPQLNSFSSNLYRDYLKMVALPKLDSIHNVSSNSTSSLKKIYDNWNSNDQDHGNCTYGSGMNQVSQMSISIKTMIDNDPVANDDLHHLHGVAELRGLLCCESLICNCEPHRSTTNLTGARQQFLGAPSRLPCYMFMYVCVCMCFVF